jgi:hypothetical protein
MANLNNLESPAPLSTTNTQIIGAGYTLPSGFNNLRQPGELSVLYAQNSDAIYNKYKLETNNSGLLRFGPRQPFITVNPNNARKGVNGLKRFESRALPVGSALQDIVRISKFSVSGNGVIFLGKQLVLQGLNTFNETKLYNPLMPILATTSIASFGLITPPTRHIEPNLGGVLGALGLNAVSNALGLNKPTPPKGTVGGGALPSINKAGGKGLIRGSTATNANKNFQNTWGGGKSAGFFSGVGNFFKSSTLFGAFIPVGQPNKEKYKVGESTYGIMASTRAIFEQPAGNLKYSFDKKVIQKWYAGTSDNTVRKGDTDETTGVRGRYFRQADGTYLIIGKRGPWQGTSIGTFPKLFGKEVELSLRPDAYQMYGRAVGNNISPDQELKNSEMLINLAYYVDSKQKYPTKFTDKDSVSVKDIEDNLKQVIDNIKSAGYKFDGETDNDLINPQFSDEKLKGYDYVSELTKDIDSQKQKVNPLNYNKGAYIKKFAFGKRKLLLDDIEGKGFSGAKYGDKINLLEVLSEELFKEKYSEDNDLIKFYFNDIVNNKYIPFRATVTGLNENLNADWSPIEYIGRADKLQSYKGFSRSLSFKFNVVANSIKELLPMWQRINYLVSLTKPANYTQGDQTNNNIYSKFIIPPLVRFTIGDIYKNQPGVIKSIGLNIPDNCVWETLSEEYAEKNDWSYLNGAFTPSGVIQWTDSKGKYAQFPRECELNLQMDLLEKERPIVGGNNFGNSVRQLNAQGDYINPNNSDSFSRKILVVDEQFANNVQVPA